MLTLVTGNPGNGKTLHTLQLVEKERLAAITEKTEAGELRYPNGRAVYQSGIFGLVLPWLPLDNPHDWYKCPEGSIIVVDEAWKAFPMRKQGSETPKYVEEFATHRHHGFDVYLVTQHRHQVDTFVRKMVGRHIHLERKFGAESARVWQWEKETDTNSSSAKELALQFDWAYPKDVYAWYKSAEIHTVKKDFPWRRFWWVGVVGVVGVVLIPYAIWRVVHMGDSWKSDTAKAGGLAPSGSSSGGAGGVGRGLIFRHGDTVPRDALLPGSAPRYDGVYHVSTAPVVSGCLQLDVGIVRRCECTNQGGQVLPLTSLECMALVRKGWFDPSQKYDDVKRLNVEFLNREAGRNVDAVVEGGSVGRSGAGNVVGGANVAAPGGGSASGGSPLTGSPGAS